MTAYEQLLAETVPDGTFGGPRPQTPEPPKPPVHVEPTSPEDQARHRAELAAAIATHRVGQPKPQPRRHLRALPNAA
ncbi:hypothetical protein DMB38_12945 [Streptomyces sp. WAC 06738]|uniref:hypothetical protein n=1 Tax=Streptomyces sp. WAC 06738 TaxID=2203210 RepID=UPI000F6C3655|nr:hypothetical protein [Streptomyces sp. WAC 06738]AZM46601.1 hypothetical protein DMB38_12945 [Streptomyces sp. WAC 06738]